MEMILLRPTTQKYPSGSHVECVPRSKSRITRNRKVARSFRGKPELAAGLRAQPAAPVAFASHPQPHLCIRSRQRPHGHVDAVDTGVVLRVGAGRRSRASARGQQATTAPASAHSGPDERRSVSEVGNYARRHFDGSLPA
jgi:hypothetical protein